MSDSQAKGTSPRPPCAPMTPTAAERSEMISVAAYYRAERRAFALGGAEDDWLHAEAEIDHLLAAMARQGVTREDYEHAGLRHALRLWVD